MSEGVVSVAGSGAGDYGQLIRAGSHELTSDEPVPTGTDSGPSPYDLLLSALGSCTAMTVRMYAAKKDWPLEDVMVTLRHDRKYAKDCEECESSSGMVAVITRKIRFKGDLDATQRQRLLEIADRCPVHKTLTGEVHIETTEDGQ